MPRKSGQLDIRVSEVKYGPADLNNILASLFSVLILEESLCYTNTTETVPPIDIRDDVGKG